MCMSFSLKQQHGTSKKIPPKPERKTWNTIRDVLSDNSFDAGSICGTIDDS